MSLTGLGVGVIVWLVASRAVARREDTRRHDAVRAELVRLDQAQSEWYAVNGRYADSLASRGSGNGAQFTPAANLQVRFQSISGEAWNATATDTSLTTLPTTCGLFRGPAASAPHRAVTRPGTVACW